MIEEFFKRFAANFRIVRCIRKFLQVLNATESFRRAFRFKCFDIACSDR